MGGSGVVVAKWLAIRTSGLGARRWCRWTLGATRRGSFTRWRAGGGSRSSPSTTGRSTRIRAGDRQLRMTRPMIRRMIRMTRPLPAERRELAEDLFEDERILEPGHLQEDHLDGDDRERRMP